MESADRASLARVQGAAWALYGVAAVVATGPASPVARFEAQTLVKAARDVAHHGAQLTGYFEGFAARARMGAWLDEVLAGPSLDRATARQLGELHRVASQALAEACGDLLARPSLELAVEGPKRPGVARTCAWAVEHLGTVEGMLRTVGGMLGTVGGGRLAGGGDPS